MIAVANYKTVPFFDRIPSRAEAAVRHATDLAASPSPNRAVIFTLLQTELRLVGVEPPTSEEFNHWFEDIRTFDGAIRECITGKVACADAQSIPQNSSEQTKRLQHAAAIVKAAHELFEAKVAGGYSPLSCGTDDTIVAEALRELLEAQAGALLDVHATTGNRLADLLLREGDRDIDDKITDILTMDMQQELCRILTRSVNENFGIITATPT